ncbi:ribosome-binding protein MDM38 SCDLUD_005192 [Saccharomycodes ludwigii]|uniref:ribosome-binding protein MDM38 n=1 Tax=Saccharomycodes ludwigii TaxID=36035 RepID=UPI001E8B1E98|nr:hypothetical protein SCDLUD_005192 [Saccharomycodes ludwigii]KAH3898853.1 hypothetical protein SCDLUD_005192 [Saccharomycodes ludwigii]
MNTSPRLLTIVNTRIISRNFNSKKLLLAYATGTAGPLNASFVYKTKSFYSTTSNTTNPNKNDKKDVATTNTAKKPKKPIMERIKHEIKHYVNGTKLLGYEIKISSKLLGKYLTGHELSRREHTQLRRTSQDVFRLFPFAAFVIIPFAELLLPIALKLFPNLLPSTYESDSDRKKKVVKLADIRSKTRLFLKETFEENAKKQQFIEYDNILDENKRKVFFKFFTKLNSPKNGVAEVFNKDEVITVAQMFKNDTVLDNLSRPQLIAMAKYMSLRPFGTDNMLRYQIRSNLKKIIEDDLSIDFEGVENLSSDELYQACVVRGIKTFGVTKQDLIDHLKVWLTLRLKDKIPGVLIILSSIYTFDGLPKEISDSTKSKSSSSSAAADNGTSVYGHWEPPTFNGNTNYDKLLSLHYDAILQVLSSIPDPVYNVAKLDVTEAEEKSSAKKKEEPETATATAAASATISTANVGSTTATATANAGESKKEEEQPKETVEKEEEEEEEPKRIDSNEFKLKVLKEQEELIKKENEEDKSRSVKEEKEQAKDDIKLDEDDAKKKN